ncbi:MAG: hypothetical protein U5N85_17480 [Arcicella sp.]|nr:hypothetical protein [Arcicella sp.]
MPAANGLHGVLFATWALFGDKSAFFEGYFLPIFSFLALALAFDKAAHGGRQ